jgi:hypothetical protein
MAGSNLVEVKLFQRWCGPPCGVIMHPAICTGVGFKVPLRNGVQSASGPPEGERELHWLLRWLWAMKALASD